MTNCFKEVAKTSINPLKLRFPVVEVFDMSEIQKKIKTMQEGKKSKILNEESWLPYDLINIF